MKTRLIALFICCYLGLVIPTVYPFSVLFESTGIGQVLHPILNYTGLWQSWNMFYEAQRNNVILGTEIHYEKGQHTVWAFPPMNQLGFWERYQKERFRKWAMDNLKSGPNRLPLIFAGQYIARLNWKDPSNKPNKIAFFECLSPIAPPLRWNQNFQDTPAVLSSERRWNCESFYDYYPTTNDFLPQT